MAFASLLDDVVVFDVPGTREAEGLYQLLQAGRLAWTYQRDGTTLVAASLRAEPEDLSDLLRSVQAWTVERSLGGVIFEVDGRAYALESPPRVTAPVLI
jgi:hypothetical protein